MNRVPEISEGKSKRLDLANLTRPCVFRVVRVSGTIRKAEEEAVRRARRDIVRLRGREEEGVLGGLAQGLEKEGKKAEEFVDDMEVDVDSGDD